MAQDGSQDLGVFYQAGLRNQRYSASLGFFFDAKSDRTDVQSVAEPGRLDKVVVGPVDEQGRTKATGINIACRQDSGEPTQRPHRQDMDGKMRMAMLRTRKCSGAAIAQFSDNDAKAKIVRQHRVDRGIANRLHRAIRKRNKRRIAIYVACSKVERRAPTLIFLRRCWRSSQTIEQHKFAIARSA